MRLHQQGVHEKFRNFSFLKCPFTAAQKNDLNRHRSGQHGADLSDKCPKDSTYRKYVREKHKDVVKFICETCGYATDSFKGLNLHKKKLQCFLFMIKEAEIVISNEGSSSNYISNGEMEDSKCMKMGNCTDIEYEQFKKTEGRFSTGAEASRKRLQTNCQLLASVSKKMFGCLL